MMQLSIVIPIYNEEAILEKEVRQIISEMGAVLPELNYELLLVENGSFDRTRSIAQQLEKTYPQVRTIYLPTAGYGQALKQGLLQSSGVYTVLFNIDFWDVQFIRRALDLLRAKNIDMAVGSKTMPGAEDARPFPRRFITRVFNALLRTLFGFRGTDTHGIKLLVREKMIPVIQACQTEREIFDTEFVLRAQQVGLKNEEIPVICREKRKTTYRISKRIPRTVKDLVVLFFTLRGQLASKRAAALLFVSALFFLGAAFWGFPDSPSPWFDEGINLGIAKTFVQDGVYSLRLGAGEYVRERGLMISTNYPVLFPMSFAFYLFGIGLAQAKIVMFLFLCLFLFLAYSLVARLSGRQAGAASVALAVTFLPFYGNGLSGGLGEVAGLVYLFSGLLLLEKERPRQIFLAGLFFGLSAATKVFYLVVLAALAVSEIWFALAARRFPSKRWAMLAIGAALPLLVWARTLLPGGFSLAALSATLTYYSNPYQVQNTALANLIKFVTESTPLHFTLLVIPLFVWYALRFREHRFSRQDAVIAVFIALNVIWFLKTPGWYRYLFPAHLTALVLFPAAASELCRRIRPQWIQKYGAAAAIAALLTAQTVHLIRERDTRLYYNPEPRSFALYLENKLGRAADVFIIDQPELWFLFKGDKAGQYIHMNPHVAFGKDIFASVRLPQYVVTTTPDQNLYLNKYRVAFENRYAEIERFGRYHLFQLR